MGWPLLIITWQRRCSILFSTLMFMPVAPTILTKNEHHFAVDSETVLLIIVIIMV